MARLVSSYEHFLCKFDQEIEHAKKNPVSADLFDDDRAGGRARRETRESNPYRVLSGSLSFHLRHNKDQKKNSEGFCPLEEVYYRTPQWTRHPDVYAQTIFANPKARFELIRKSPEGLRLKIFNAKPHFKLRLK